MPRCRVGRCEAKHSLLVELLVKQHPDQFEEVFGCLSRRSVYRQRVSTSSISGLTRVCVRVSSESPECVADWVCVNGERDDALIRRLSPRWMTGDNSVAELGCPPQLGFVNWGRD